MAKYNSNRQQNLNIGIVSYTEDKTVLEVTGKVGIGTTNATSKLHVIGDARVTGVVTASSFRGDGSQLTGVTGTQIVTQDSISTPVFLTFANNIGVTSLGVATTGSNVLSVIPSLGNLGIGTTNPQQKLWVEGNGYFTGILTANRIFSSQYGEFVGGSISGTNVVGTSLSISGISTLGTVKISSGIITATSGVVTYYGDGRYLDLTNNSRSGIGSTFTSGAVNGNLFYHIDYGKLFVYYDEVALGIGNNAFWVDAAPFNVGNIPIPITFSPSIGATGVAPNSNIIITFSQQITKGTGNITLRENSASGTAFSTINVSSSSVTISGGAVTIDPPENIGTATTTFVVVDAGAFSGLTTTFVNALINTYSFTTAEESAPFRGDSYEGGFLICKASPLRWVVSPRSAEVSRTWYLREDANTTAQSVSGCTGWFVPTVSQLQNPGYCCRSFWGPSPCYSSTTYWSSTEFNGHAAWFFGFNAGHAVVYSKSGTRCVRAFRCVTY